MSVILKLTDDVDFCQSTLGMAGAFLLIAKQLPEAEELPARWLRDLCDRCAPFLDFDLRGLPLHSRVSFIEAAYAAYDKLRVKYGSSPPDNAFSFFALKGLCMTIEDLRDSIPNYPDVNFEGEAIDLGDLWNVEQSNSG